MAMPILIHNSPTDKPVLKFVYMNVNGDILLVHFRILSNVFFLRFLPTLTMTVGHQLIIFVLLWNLNTRDKKPLNFYKTRCNGTDGKENETCFILCSFAYRTRLSRQLTCSTDSYATQRQIENKFLDKNLVKHLWSAGIGTYKILFLLFPFRRVLASC